jgi:adenylyltransferase/sulfurtransferase
LRNFGLEAQLKLKRAGVLIIGAGGLGCPALYYLAAAGVGKIGIADFDRVQESNLQRQVLFTTDDVGKNKAMAAASRLASLNPNIELEPHPFRIDHTNAMEIISEYDVIFDGSDNFPTRYLVNDACVLAGTPLVYGSILEYEGQLAVFNALRDDGSRSLNYRDLFPNPPMPDEVPNCEQAGVLGVLPGTIGSLMANEVIKLITGISEPVWNRLHLFDSLTLETTVIKIPDRKARESIKKLIDYDSFCGLTQKSKSLDMKEVTVNELKAMMDSNSEFQLIDVREPHENEISNLGGQLIPMAEVPHNLDRISKDKKVVIHCRTGGRSGSIIQWLEKNHGFKNLYNLKGGIKAWAQEIDPSMPTA